MCLFAICRFTIVDSPHADSPYISQFAICADSPYEDDFIAYLT